MKNTIIKGLLLLFTFSMIMSCQQSQDTTLDQPIPHEVIHKLKEMGFNPDGIERVEEGYRIERDIIIRDKDLDLLDFSEGKKGTHKHYHTNNLVSTNGGRTITVYMPVESGGRGKKSSGFNSNYSNALDMAISRYNALNITLDFQRVTSTNADIVFTRLGKRDERQGVLGSAGFPSGGDPYGEIKMNGTIDSRYNWGVEAIATVMAHEMGHCIGFRHTDYFDRSLSCGGSATNEGDGGVGANHISGTPTGFSAESWMLSCTGGGDRPFTMDDIQALTTLY